MLCFGNEAESVLVVATYPKESEKDLSDKLRKSILSAKWDDASEVDFFEGLTFRVKESGVYISHRHGLKVVGLDDFVAHVDQSTSFHSEGRRDDYFSVGELLQAPLD